MASKSPVQIDVHGDEAAAKLVYGLAQRGEDPRPAFKQIIEEMRLAEPQWFSSKGAGTWPSLADVTREAKIKNGQPSTQPLVATGDLYKSLTLKRGAKGVRSATKQRMRFGSKVWYGKFHKLGSWPVPYRNPLIPLNERSRRRMVNDVKNYMLGRTKGKA